MAAANGRSAGLLDAMIPLVIVGFMGWVGLESNRNSNGLTAVQTELIQVRIALNTVNEERELLRAAITNLTLTDERTKNALDRLRVVEERVNELEGRVNQLLASTARRS